HERSGPAGHGVRGVHVGAPSATSGRRSPPCGDGAFEVIRGDRGGRSAGGGDLHNMAHVGGGPSAISNGQRYRVVAGRRVVVGRRYSAPRRCPVTEVPRVGGDRAFRIGGSGAVERCAEPGGSG